MVRISVCHNFSKPCDVGIYDSTCDVVSYGYMKKILNYWIAYPVPPPHPTPSTWMAIFLYENWSSIVHMWIFPSLSQLSCSTLSNNTAKASEIRVAKWYFQRQTEAALYYCWKIRNNIENHSGTSSPFIGIYKTFIDVKKFSGIIYLMQKVWPIVSATRHWNSDWLRPQDVKGSHPNAIVTFFNDSFLRP